METVFPTQTVYPFEGPSEKPSEQPSVQHPESNFHILLKKMGSVSSYEESFMNAKERWESLIMGDLIDIPRQPYPDFDWFEGTWQDHRTNAAVDDVIIGYEIGTIDGPGEILGVAGPTYARQTLNEENQTVGITTIAG